MLILTSLALAEAPSGAGQSIALVHQVEPRFPREARRQRISHAECSVLVRVTPEGVPDDLHLVACDDLFADATLAAIARWRFEVTPPSAAQFRVVVTYDYPKKEGSRVTVEAAPEAPPEPPIEPVPVPAEEEAP